MKKKILFIAYSSNILGYGHISRSLSLISKLPSNIHPVLLTNNKPTISNKAIESKTEVFYEVNDCLLDLDLDIVLYDLPYSDITLLEKVPKFANIPIYALDNFDYSSDFINTYINLFDQKPNAIKPKNKTIKQGLEYAIISDKILNIRKEYKEKLIINNILIMFGGADPKNLTKDVLIFLNSINHQCNIYVVLGPLNNNFDCIVKLSKKLKYKINIFYNPDNLPEIMSKQDLSFSGCATTFFELSFLGVPSIILTQNDAERNFANYLEQQKLVQNINLSLMERWTQMQNIDIYNEFRQNQLNTFTGNGVNNIFSIMEIC
jgi:spore coat polysaccharide biosynthesis predicted glycosyltransferase SpsG